MSGENIWQVDKLTNELLNELTRRKGEKAGDLSFHPFVVACRHILRQLKVRNLYGENLAAADTWK